MSLRRFMSFGLIGGVIFVSGSALLFFLVSVLGMNETVAYIIQATFSVLSSFLLNWKVTWKNHGTALKRSAARFVVMTAVTIPCNTIVFSVLVWWGLHYMLANILTIAMFTLVKFAISHKWVFASVDNERIEADPRNTCEQFANGDYPDVGVVIPVKNSNVGIRECVESLLSQDYRGTIKIVLVGDPGDTSWNVLGDYIISGQITALEVDVVTERRDSNAKRTTGLNSLNTPILALTDSDMQLPTDWVSEAVAIVREGWECAGGPMESLGKGYWSTYVDRNPILSKTPRMHHDYVVTADTIGRKATPPITAAVVFTQDAYMGTGGLNMHMTQSYEDYEFFDRMTRNGVSILCTPRLVGRHAHREQFRALLRDYVRTGAGCADFVHYNAESVFARQRMWSVILLGFAFVVTPLVGAILSIVLPVGLAWLAASGVCTYIGLAIYCTIRTKQLVALSFPFVTAVFCLASWYGYVRRIVHVNRHGRRETTINSVSPVRSIA